MRQFCIFSGNGVSEQVDTHPGCGGAAKSVIPVTKILGLLLFALISLGTLLMAGCNNAPPPQQREPAQARCIPCNGSGTCGQCNNIMLNNRAHDVAGNHALIRHNCHICGADLSGRFGLPRPGVCRACDGAGWIRR